MQESVAAQESSFTLVETGKLGMWLFILSEVLLFGAIISSYFMTRWGSSVCALGSPAWPDPIYRGSLSLAFINTIILITSSYTMVRTLSASLRREDKSFKTFLLATVALGSLFLVVKIFEYVGKIRHGYYPGSELMQANPGFTIFLSYYYLLTGLHALHVFAGVMINFFILKSHWGLGITEHLSRKLETAGLYWHFVYIVWVFLFPLLYLI